MEPLEDRTLLAADLGFVFSLDGNGSFELTRGIATDDSGNAYVTGYFNGVMDADPGAGVSGLSSSGINEGFVAKYDPSGDLLWAQSFGGFGDTQANAVGLDSSGNLLVSGRFTGTADFDPGAGVYNLSSQGAIDGFLLKLDSSGDFVWAFNVGGSGSDVIIGLDVDGNDNIYTTGAYQSGAANIDFDPSAFSTFTPSINGGGLNDVFVAKYDSSGNLSWAKAFGSSSYDLGNAIAVDASGNVFTTGDFWGGDIDPGPEVQLEASHGGRDAFVQKLDTNGNFLWGGTMGGLAGDNVEGGISVAVDSTGASYFTGIFGLTADLDPGPAVANFTAVGPNSNGLPPVDGFLIKLNQNGVLVWARQLGNDGFDPIRGVTIDGQDHVWASGHFQGTVDFDPSAAIENESVPGNIGLNGATTGAFVWELDSNGAFVSVSTFIGPAMSGAFGDQVSVDPQGDIWTTGGFFNTVDFDPGPGVVNLTAVDSFDVFVAKLVQNKSPVALNDSYVINEDATLTVNAAGGLLLNDTDADLDSLSVTQFMTEPNNGSLTLNTDGSFVYVPEDDFNGINTFTYEISDGKGGLATAMVTLIVAPVNDDPVAVDIAFATFEDTPLNVAANGVLANDGDIDGDALFAILGSGPSHGTLAFDADGSFLYTPDADFNGSDSFSYMANDGKADSNVATVTLTIAPVNDAPVASSESYFVNEDGVLTVNAADGVLTNDSDLDMDALSVMQVVSGPSNAVLTLNANGSFEYIPLADFNGIDSFVYEVSDGNGGLATATVTITVLSTQDQIDSIIANLENLVGSGDLAEKDADILIKNLKKAEKELAKGRNDKTINELKKFQRKVQQLVDKTTFPAADALQILAAADDTIEAAGVSAPQAASQAIINGVQSLIDADELTAKDGNKLKDQLSKAIKEFTKLHVSHGIDGLEKFIAKVDQLVDEGKLLAAEGQPLQDAANTIINNALPGSPLRAAQFAGGRGRTGGLTADVLRPIVDQAIAHWYSSEPDTALLGHLKSVTVDVIQLPGRLLGLATSSTIWIDADAAGYGWNVGSTFGTTTIDLLSTVTHEFGHLLGYDHDRGLGVMAATLGVNQQPVQSSAPHASLISLYASIDGIGRGSPTTTTSLDTAINRSSFEDFFSLDSVLGKSRGLAVKGDATLASRLLSQPIGVKEMTGELGDVNLPGIFDERLLEHLLDDNEGEGDWHQTVDQAFSKATEA